MVTQSSLLFILSVSLISKEVDGKQLLGFGNDSNLPLPTPKADTLALSHNGVVIVLNKLLYNQISYVKFNESMIGVYIVNDIYQYLL